MDPSLIAIFRKRTGVTDPIPPLNPAAVAASAEPEKKKRRLTKASEKEKEKEKQTALALRPPKPPSVPEAQGKGKEKEKEKEKSRAPEQGRSVPPVSASGPQVTRGPSGVHPGPVVGVGVASLISGKKPFQEEKDAFELYSPLVPQSEFENFTRLSGEALVRKICHIDAQAHTIAFAAGKKALALETSLRNSQAALTEKKKEVEVSQSKTAALAAELMEARSKIDALEVEANQSRALKEKNAGMAQVIENLKHQISVKNEGLKKAVEAAKAAESQAKKADEALRTEGERAVAAFQLSTTYEAALENAVEEFKKSVAGEQFLLEGIERWQEEEDGKFFKVYNFNLGFEDFRKAAKNRFPELDLSQVCLEDLFPAPAETATAAETGLEGGAEGGEEVSKPDGVVAAPPVTDPSPILDAPTASVDPVPDAPPPASVDPVPDAPPPALVETSSSAAKDPVQEQTAPSQS